MALSKGQELELLLQGSLAMLLVLDFFNVHELLLRVYLLVGALVLVLLYRHQWRRELGAVYLSLVLFVTSLLASYAASAWSTTLRWGSVVSLALGCVVAFLFPLPDLTQLHGEYQTIGGRACWYGGVECRVFYPSSEARPNKVQERKRLPYLHFGDHLMRGLQVFSQVPQWAFGNFRNASLAAVEQAPVAIPPTLEGWPVVIFSHGLAGSLEMYASVNQQLASDGNIVIVVNHADGSGSVMRRAEDASVEYYHQITPEVRDNIDGAGYRFRHDQLEQRVTEVRRVLDAVTKATQEQSGAALDDLLASMDLNNVRVAGHSFGAATALTAAHEDERFRVAVLLDAWMEPVADEVKQGMGTRVPVLHLISEHFYHWKPNFVDIQKHTNGSTHAASKLLMMTKTRHNNFSDLPIFSPLINRLMKSAGSIDPHVAHRSISQLSAAFLRVECEAISALSQFPHVVEVAE